MAEVQLGGRSNSFPAPLDIEMPPDKSVWNRRRLSEDEPPVPAVDTFVSPPVASGKHIPKSSHIPDTPKSTRPGVLAEMKSPTVSIVELLQKMKKGHALSTGDVEEAEKLLERLYSMRSHWAGSSLEVLNEEGVQVDDELRQFLSDTLANPAEQLPGATVPPPSTRRSSSAGVRTPQQHDGGSSGGRTPQGHGVGGVNNAGAWNSTPISDNRGIHSLSSLSSTNPTGTHLFMSSGGTVDRSSSGGSAVALESNRQVDNAVDVALSKGLVSQNNSNEKHGSNLETGVANLSAMDSSSSNHHNHYLGSSSPPTSSPTSHPSHSYPSHRRTNPTEFSARALRALELGNSWEQYDAYVIDDATQGKCLSSLGVWLFQTYHFPEEFGLDMKKVAKAFHRFENLYHDNPYHNRWHAADVLQCCHFILSYCGMSIFFTPLEQLAILLSALIHDLDHPGTNNAFQVATNSGLALRYNDRSVLENHHVAMAFSTMWGDAAAREDVDFLCCLTSEERQNLRKMVIEMVLGTDLAVNLEIVNLFKMELSQGKFDPLIDGVKHGSIMVDDLCASEDRILLMKMIVKCADISHVARPLHYHLTWTANVTKEFYAQGDRERDLHLPVAPFMDRFVGGLAKGQAGFLQFVAKPMWVLLEPFMSNRILLDQLESNLDHWQAEARRDADASALKSLEKTEKAATVVANTECSPNKQENNDEEVKKPEGSSNSTGLMLAPPVGAAPPIPSQQQQPQQEERRRDDTGEN